ncbi:hypothetical protein DFH09DRAFT_1090925 [Mycena vulgaris]|nr:hypothetical protein DFH09DRAFT_1090925 [Mycena vulgaris]
MHGAGIPFDTELFSRVPTQVPFVRSFAPARPADAPRRDVFVWPCVPPTPAPDHADHCTSFLRLHSTPPKPHHGIDSLKCSLRHALLTPLPPAATPFAAHLPEPITRSQGGRFRLTAHPSASSFGTNPSSSFALVSAARAGKRWRSSLGKTTKTQSNRLPRRRLAARPLELDRLGPRLQIHPRAADICAALARSSPFLRTVESFPAFTSGVHHLCTAAANEQPQRPNRRAVVTVATHCAHGAGVMGKAAGGSRECPQPITNQFVSRASTCRQRLHAHAPRRSAPPHLAQRAARMHSSFTSAPRRHERRRRGGNRVSRGRSPTHAPCGGDAAAGRARASTLSCDYAQQGRKYYNRAVVVKSLPSAFRVIPPAPSSPSRSLRSVFPRPTRPSPRPLSSPSAPILHRPCARPPLPYLLAPSSVHQHARSLAALPSSRPVPSHWRPRPSPAPPHFHPRTPAPLLRPSIPPHPTHAPRAHHPPSPAPPCTHTNLRTPLPSFFYSIHPAPRRRSLRLTHFPGVHLADQPRAAEAPRAGFSWRPGVLPVRFPRSLLARPLPVDAARREARDSDPYLGRIHLSPRGISFAVILAARVISYAKPVVDSECTLADLLPTPCASVVNHSGFLTIRQIAPPELPHVPRDPAPHWSRFTLHLGQAPWSFFKQDAGLKKSCRAQVHGETLFFASITKCL